MSSITYEEMLREALVDLSEMQEQDMQSVGMKLGGPNGKAKDYGYFLNHWGPMYLRYVQIARNLEKVHDQILQPQKRHDARVLLDSCIGRMLEMKKRIVEACGGYVNFDEALVDLKLTPEALEIPIPRYFVEERFEELNERRQYVRSLIDHYVRTEPDAPVTLAAESANTAPVVMVGKGATAFPMPEKQPMALEQAVLILQCNERGRQGRQTAKFHRTIFEQELHQHREFEYGSTTGKDQAATRIQKIALGYLARKHVKTMLKNELEFLGMAPSQQILSNFQRDKARKAMVERKMKQANNVAELAQEAKDLRARIKLQEGGRTMEEMLDEVLEKMAIARMTAPSADVLPTFPTEEEGGSLALLGKRTLKPEEIAIAKREREEAEKQAKAEAKKKDNTRKKDTDEERPVISGSIFWDVFTEARERYANVWHSKFQSTYLDKKEFDQRYDKDLLRQEVTEGPGGTEVELRKCVDQLVMVEVANLRERMELQLGMKKKKPKKPKVKKVKLPKDPSDGAKLESFINTAVYLGVLQLPDESLRVQDYLGTHNMMESALAEHLRANAEQSDEIKAKWDNLLKNWNPYVEQSVGMNKESFEVLFRNYCNASTWMFEPSAAQVRQAVIESCVLPLGSQTISDLCSFSVGRNGPNTCLLYGFKSSGKTMLSHAVCNESGSNFFNLSPRHFNPGSGAGKIIQMVFRLARALAPSVIYIDEAELIFVNRKATRSDPVAARATKMKKDLLNCIKDLQPTDRVLVLGNSRKPWEGVAKDMNAFWRQYICCVHPDYASRMELWQKLLHRKGAVLPNYSDYEILAHITNKYTSGVIASVINETLTDRRLRRLVQRPLQLEEFLPALSRATPIYKEEYDKMNLYSASLPLTSRRAQTTDFEEPKDPKAKPAPKKPAPKKA